MRSHAKAPSAGLVCIAAGVAFFLALLLLGTATERASAAPGRPYLETIPTAASAASLDTDAAGNIYVHTGGLIERIDASGNPVDFSASASYISGNKLTGVPGEVFNEPSTALGGDVAVSPFNGYIYVSLSSRKTIPPGGGVVVFAPSGEYVGVIPTINYQCSVGIHPVSGDLYLSVIENPFISRWAVVGGNPADDVINGRLRMADALPNCSIEVDSSGALYVSTLDGRLMKYTEAELSPPSGPLPVAPGTEVGNYQGVRPSAVSIEPSTDNVFSTWVTAAMSTDRGARCSPNTPLSAARAAPSSWTGSCSSRVRSADPRLRRPDSAPDRQDQCGCRNQPERNNPARRSRSGLSRKCDRVRIQIRTRPALHGRLGPL